MDQQELQKKIIEISKLNISNEEKQKKIQAVFNNNASKFVKKKKNNIICKHYKNRKCLIVSPCCNNIYNCRICHDENEDHKIDRYAIENIICKQCDQNQKCSNKCINCNINFGDYYCNICHLWISNEKDEEVSVYHCDKCNICRKGKKEDYIHCDKCNLCLSKNIIDSHKCVEITKETICCICNETIFDSINNMSVLNCGHKIHSQCLQEWSKKSYKCPLCKKSFCDMKNYWLQIDQFLENQEMPDELKNKKCNILCNDCNLKSIVNYHFLYNKCTKCLGYNTDIIDIL